MSDVTSNPARQAINADHGSAPRGFNARLKDSQMFHSGSGQVHDTLKAIVKTLKDAASG